MKILNSICCIFLCFATAYMFYTGVQQQDDKMFFGSFFCLLMAIIFFLFTVLAEKDETITRLQNKIIATNPDFYLHNKR